MAATEQVPSSHKDTDADVRIAAQRLEDRSVRLGLRVRDANGVWAEPATPRAHRFDPATARVGRWLVSSPLLLEINESGRGRLLQRSQFEPVPTGDALLVTGLEEWHGDTHLSAYHDAGGDLITRASIYSASVGAPDGELRTTITCQGGETSASLGGLPSDIGDASFNPWVQVSWSVDNGPRHTEGRTIKTGDIGPELVQPTQGRLLEALLSKPDAPSCASAPRSAPTSASSSPSSSAPTTAGATTSCPERGSFLPSAKRRTGCYRHLSR